MKKSSQFVIKHFELIRIAAAVLIGFALALVFLLFVSKDPLDAPRRLRRGYHGSKFPRGVPHQSHTDGSFCKSLLHFIQQLGQLGVFELVARLVGDKPRRDRHELLNHGQVIFT